MIGLRLEYYLKLHHGLLHALHVKDHPDELLDGLGQLRLGASTLREPLHSLLVLPGNTETQTISAIDRDTIYDTIIF